MKNINRGTIEKIQDDLDEDKSHATSDISNVCRTMSLALFAAGIFDIWNGEAQVVSIIVVIATITTILLDLVQYCATALLSIYWNNKLESGEMAPESVEAKQDIFHRVCMTILGFKVFFVLANCFLVIFIIVK